MTNAKRKGERERKGCKMGRSGEKRKVRVRKEHPMVLVYTPR